MKIILLLILLAAAAHSAKTLAVLEIVLKSEVEVSTAEQRHLTDELRRQAVLALSRDKYAVLTRDNIFALLPPDEAAMECLEESCVIEIGRAIGAEYVTQGSIGHFDNDLTLTIELYETMRGKLLSSVVIESPDIRGLLLAIRENAPSLFAPLQLPLTPPDTPPSGEVYIPNPIPHTQKSNSTFYIALTLDLLGAAAIGIGIYQNTNASNLHKDYKNMPKYLSRDEYNNKYKEVEAAKTDRNILYAVGGALLAAGIGVHILF